MLKNIHKMDEEHTNQSKKKSSKPFRRNWFLSLSSKKKRRTSISTNKDNLDEQSCTETAKESSKPIERNVFQIFKKKLESRFSSSRQKKTSSMRPQVSSSVDDSDRSEIHQANESLATAADNVDADLEGGNNFTHHYQKHLMKKWLERESAQNMVMWKASSEMLGHVWYWGELSRQDAQKQLTDKPNGSFLVRDSETKLTQFALSFRIGNWTLHYRLQYRDNYWHFEDLQYESIVEMIEDIMDRSTDDNFVCFVKVPSELQPPFPVQLKYPISRYMRLPTLQDLSRRVIQRCIATDQIDLLPIPTKLQQYLHEKTTQIV